MNKRAIVLFVLAFALFYVLPAEAVIIDKVIAVVNDLIITQAEMARILMPVYNAYSKELNGEKLKQKMLEAEDEALNQLVEQKLILSEARRRGVEAPDEEVSERLDEMKSRFSGEEKFSQALLQDNITLPELREMIREDVIRSILVQRELGWRVSMTPTEIRRYYDEHTEAFSTPESARVRGVLIRKGQEGRSDEDARFLVEKVRDLLASGASIKELAREYSDGPDALNDGDMGLIERGDMLPAIDEAIFSLTPGCVSDIVESPLGFHIFTIEARQPERVMGFEEVKDGIREVVYRAKIQESMKAWIRELKRDAYISIK